MKALTLTQPWASAVALGIKHWETRSWPTGYRGEIAIHAAKTMPKFARDFALRERVTGRLPELLPRGVILCVCELTECRLTEYVRPQLGEIEVLYGDYSARRFAFKLEKVKVLSEPVPCLGKLGLWEVEWDTWRLAMFNDGMTPEQAFGESTVEQDGA